MAIGSNLSGINFSGLASGLDTETIIAQLMLIQQRPLRRLQVRQAELSARMDIYDKFRAQLGNLQTAASALASSNAFNLLKVTSSDTSVVTATASPDAAAGIYDIRVSQLAQAHKLLSEPHPSATAELGVAGSFLINGKVIEVVERDTLSSIASKINSANAGVTASLINGGEGQVYLSLTAKETGANSKIHLSDIGNGTVLATLKLVSATEVFRNQRADGVYSDRFTSPETAIGTLLGMRSPTSGTIQINGTPIALDFSTDSLNSIANKINSAGIQGVSASVVSETEKGKAYYRLKITGVSDPSAFTDDQNLLKNLGILQKSYTREMVAAQDASFTVDGVAFTRSTNQISDVITGVVFTLLSADSNNPKRATLTIDRDLNAIKKNITDFVNVYNGVVDFIKENASFDKETFRSGILFADQTVENIRDHLIRQITDEIEGLSGTLRTLAQIGITLDGEGKLQIDDGTLTAALNGDLNEVGRLFYAYGSTTDANIQYISATSKTKPSPKAGYEVVITQIATLATATATVAQTERSTAEERLTFNGKLFGNTEYTLLLNANNSIDDTIAQINNDSKLRNLVVASKDANGKLVITAKNYGSDSSFTVVSDQAAASNNSGIGNTPIEANGLDVAGTINGEPATGKGQFLTGNSGNPNTDGLQIRVLATTPGTYGAVKFSRGVGDSVRNYIQSVTDIITGDLTTATKGLQEQIDAIKEQMKILEEDLARKEVELRQQFARLESLLSQLQSQSARLNAMMNGALLRR